MCDAQLKWPAMQTACDGSVGIIRFELGFGFRVVFRPTRGGKRGYHVLTYLFCYAIDVTFFLLFFSLPRLLFRLPR